MTSVLQCAMLTPELFFTYPRQVWRVSEHVQGAGGRRKSIKDAVSITVINFCQSATHIRYSNFDTTIIISKNSWALLNGNHIITWPWYPQLTPKAEASPRSEGRTGAEHFALCNTLYNYLSLTVAPAQLCILVQQFCLLFLMTTAKHCHIASTQ